MKFMKLGSKPDSFHRDGNNVRCVATDLATDIVVNVADVKFHLHKFPLLAKCERLKELLSSADEQNRKEVDFHDIPGGSAAFETCAKFCYDITISLNAHNIIPARCAAYYLQMHENMEKGNLVYKIDVFFSSTVLKTWKDSITALKTSQNLVPLSEELNLVNRCIDSIADLASLDVSRVDWSYTYNRKKVFEENVVGPGPNQNRTVPDDWWAEDLSGLGTDIYERVIIAIKNKGSVPNNVIGEALKAYAYRKLPSSSKGGIVIKQNDVERFQAVLETIVRLLPEERGSVLCGFLLKLLKAAASLNLGGDIKAELVKRIGWQLEEACVKDLLITGEKTKYDVGMVQKMIEHFKSQGRENGSEDSEETRQPPEITLLSEASEVMVAKIVDGYLAEIAKDPNLPLSVFVSTADMLSGFSRASHDALYRAIDTYLKNHPETTKGERKRICGLMDCRRLSSAACTHAVQNDRLPLRVAVQILFFEQMRSATRSGASTPDHSKLVNDDLRSKDGGEELREARNDAAAQGNERGNMIGGCKDKATCGKTRKMFMKVWSTKERDDENSGSSDDEAKCTPARGGRRSVS